MKQNILVLVLFALLFSPSPLVSAQDWSIPCNFQLTAPFYDCVVNAVATPDNENTNFIFTGAHLPNQNANTVTRLMIQNSRMYFIIRQAFVQFPNLRVYSVVNGVTLSTMRIQPNAFQQALLLEQVIINNAGLTNVSANAFVGATNLQVINFQQNQIQNIPADLLSTLPNLHTVNFQTNQLTDVNQNLFQNSPLLEIINLNNNQLTSLHNNLLNRNTRLVQFLAQANQINGIGRRFLDNLNFLTTLNLIGNVCVSQGWNNIGTGININDVNNALQVCFDNYGGVTAEPRSFRMNVRGRITLWREDGTLVGTL